jgi:DNA replication initiation complex subunit (GINS family)
MKGDDQDNSKAILQEIGEVHASEKGSIKLTKLPDDFYERANSYIRSTLAKMENHKAQGKVEISEEYYRLSEEYRRSKDILNNIYNTRERKIVLMAMNSARKISHSTNNMIHDEMELFFDLKLEMEKIRGRILKFGARSQEPLRAETGIDTPLADYVESEPEELSPFGGSKSQVQEKKEPKMEMSTPKEDAPSELGHQRESVDKDRSEVPKDMVLVKALKDIATFMCPDKTSISMKKEDIALLPKEIAEILSSNGSVEPIGGTK